VLYPINNLQGFDFNLTLPILQASGLIQDDINSWVWHPMVRQSTKRLFFRDWWTLSATVPSG
jgi:hypothetical protein